MKEIVVSIFALLGCSAVLLAALGLIRFPEFFSRTHAATKASAFGLGALLLANCVMFFSWSLLAKSVFVIFAVFLTLPVASQALAEAVHGRSKSETDD